MSSPTVETSDDARFVTGLERKPASLTTNAALKPDNNPMPIQLTNVHPADELAAIREEIAQLTKRHDFLRDQLLADGASLEGDSYRAVIQPGKRETLDRKAITEAFGEDAIAPYVKATQYKTVKLVEIE